MRLLKQIVILFLFGALVLACNTTKVIKEKTKNEKPVVIKNDSLEYEITILDIGFNTYLESTARPRSYYSQTFLETRNKIYVTNWNIRVRNPFRFNPNIYQNIIDYQPNTNYGYEVNYLLYNYFLFAQQKYKMRLGGFVNRVR